MIKCSLTEVWRDVIGFEGLYSVSDHGRVRRDAPTRGFGSVTKPGRILQSGPSADGYHSISIYPPEGKCKTRLVHRLVATAFLGEPSKGLVVNHIDGCKENNYLYNLEYITNSENIRHAYRIGLAKGKRGEANPMAVLNDDTVRAIKTLAHQGWSTASLVRAFRTDTSRIVHILRGDIWQYVDLADVAVSQTLM